LAEGPAEALQILKEQSNFSAILCTIAQAGKDTGIIFLEKLKTINVQNIPVISKSCVESFDS
jgi:CheY-like chemotaxis protein